MSDQKKRNRSAWNNHKKQRSVEPGASGLLFTCHGDERRAVVEAYRLIDQLHHCDPTDGVSEDEGEESVEKQLAALRDAHKKGTKMPKQRPTGVKNVIFINIPGASPSELCSKLVTLCQNEDNTRFLDRALPVEETENVDLPKLNQMVLSMVQQNLDASKSPIPTYALEFKARNNSQVKRDNVLEMLNDAVATVCPAARVNLADPDVTFFVQVVHKSVMVGTCYGFNRRKKYSLRKVEAASDVKAEAEASENKVVVEKTEEPIDVKENKPSENPSPAEAELPDGKEQDAESVECVEKEEKEEKSDGEPESKRIRVVVEPEDMNIGQI